MMLLDKNRTIFLRPSHKKKLLSVIASTLSIVVLSNVAFAYKPEANVWEERRMQMTSLPADFSNLIKTTSALKINSSESLAPLQSALSNNPSHQTKVVAFDRALPATIFNHLNLKQVNVGKSQSMVVLVEDVHQNLEAQTHLSAAIKDMGKLSGQNKVLVGLEGAQGAFLFDEYHQLSDRNIRNMVADSFFQTGEISGPSHAGFTFEPTVGQRGLKFWGVDEAGFYKLNLEAYKQSHQIKSVVESKIASLIKTNESEKSQTLNQDLKNFDKTVQSYHEGKMQLGDYVALLAKRNENTSLNLDSFLQAYLTEKNINFAQVESERAVVLGQLVKKISQKEIQSLAGLSVEYQKGTLSFADYYSTLRSLCSSAKVELSKYPHFDSYIRYVLLADKVNAPELVAEVSRLEEATYSALTKNEIEKSLIEKSKQLYLSQELIKFALTSDQWASYLKGKKIYQAELKLDVFEQFYKSADIRSQFMAEHMLASMKDEKTNTGLLVAGGYHTEGLIDQLKKKGISVVVFTPKLTKIENDSGSSYLSVFDREKTRLSEVFSGKKLFLAAPPAGAKYSISQNAVHGMMAYYAAVLTADSHGYPDLSPDAIGLLNTYGLQVENALIRRENDRVVANAVINGLPVETVLTHAETVNPIAIMKGQTEQRDFVNGTHLVTREGKKPLTFSDLFSFNRSHVSTPVLISIVSAYFTLGQITFGTFILGYGIALGIALIFAITLGLLFRQSPIKNAEVKKEKLSSESSLRKMLTDMVGIAKLSSVAALDDSKTREMAINAYNVEVGGLLNLVKGRTPEEVTPTPRVIPAKVNNAVEKDFIESVSNGEKAWMFAAGGRATRLALPSAFDRIGLAGLTPAILKRMQELGYEDVKLIPKVEEFSDLIDRAANGVTENENDLSFLQRQILQIWYQLSEISESSPAFNLKEILEGVRIVITVNSANREALQNQVKALNFPGKVFFIEQPEVGGLTVPNGKNTPWQWDESSVFPEGHGEPFIAMVQKVEGAFAVEKDGTVRPIDKTLRDELAGLGVKNLFFGQSNDLHFLSNAISIERWKTAEDQMQESGAEMVLEFVDNKIKQKGGGAFKKADSDDIVMRDTIAMKHPDLEKFSIPKSISRMAYFINLNSLGKLNWDTLPYYFGERKTGVLTREVYSGDATSALRSRIMQQKDFEIKTFKERPRIQVALGAVLGQNSQVRFQKFLISNRITLNQSEKSEIELRRMVKEAAALAGISESEMSDSAKRERAINLYNVKVGGLPSIINGRSQEEVNPQPVRIPYSAGVDAEKEFLREVQSGKKAWAISAGGRATRLALPSTFDRLGLSGLTPLILKRLKQLGYEDKNKIPKADEFNGLIDRAAKGMLESAEDLSLLQRYVLQLQAQIEGLVLKYPEDRMNVAEVLSGVTIIVTVNSANRDAIQNQIAALKFPGKVRIIEQPEVGGLEFPGTNGNMAWNEKSIFPEGHGQPFIAMAQQAAGLYEVTPTGYVRPMGKTLQQTLIDDGVEHFIFAQGNDMHLLKDIASIERWTTALEEMKSSNTEMVLEFVDNAIKQKGGGAFQKENSPFIEMRDTIAMKDDSLVGYQIPVSISRMVYVIKVSALSKLDWHKLPYYLGARDSGVFTREVYSGDATSLLNAKIMQQQGFAINTFKERPRIDVALKAISDQDSQPLFSSLIREFEKNHLFRSLGIEPAHIKITKDTIVAQTDKLLLIINLLDSSLLLQNLDTKQESKIGGKNTSGQINQSLLLSLGFTVIGVFLIPISFAVGIAVFSIGIVSALASQDVIQQRFHDLFKKAVSVEEEILSTIREEIFGENLSAIRIQERADQLIALREDLTHIGIGDPQVAALVLAGPHGKIFGALSNQTARLAALHGIQISISSSNDLHQYEVMSLLVSYLEQIEKGNVLSFDQSLKELRNSEKGKAAVVKAIHVGQVTSLIEEDLDNLEKAISDLNIKNRDKSAVQNIVAILHEGLSADQKSRYEKIISRSKNVGSVLDVAVPVEGDSKSYNTVLAMALVQNPRLQAVKSLRNESFENASFETFDRVPGAYQATGALRAVWLLLMNLENNGWAFVPVESAFEAAQRAKVMA